MGPRLTALLLLPLLLAAAAPRAAALNFELQPGLRVEEEYNDNVFLRTDNRVGDFVTTVYPGFKAAARSATGGVEAQYELGYSYYYDQGVDFTRHQAGLRAYQALSPHLSLEALDTFYRYEDLIEPGLGTLAPRAALLPYLRNTATPRLIYLYAPESDVTVTWTNILLKNDDPALQDSFGNRLGFDVRHALDHHNHLSLGYSFEKGDFSFVATPLLLVLPDFTANRAHLGYVSELSRTFQLTGVYDFEDLDFTGDTVSDYRTHELRAGVIYVPRPDWSATLTAGYYRVDRSQGGGTGGLAADVLVQKTLELGVISVAYRRGLAEDYYSGDNAGVFRYWMGGGGLTYFLGQHLGAVVEATGGKRNYLLIQRTDEYWSVQTGLIYRLRKWLDAGVRYERYWLKSTPGPFDFANNRYIATIGATY